METFLQRVAQDLYQKRGNDLSHTAIVFPNKRARLFFNEYLARQSERPLWSPAYISISELFRQFSSLQAGDSIRLVCELHKVFCEATHSEETLDEFYFWGELLISDFDDADKNLVDADRLFSNLKDLKNILDDNDFLSPEQKEALREFFHNFSPERETQLKQRFAALWNVLGDIYHNYRERLETLGIAYEGMMYRQVIEKLQPEHLPYECYVFVGFNVLNRVEARLFRLLQEAGKAMFYWDYDHFYTTRPGKALPPYTHEAGEFILRNLKEFPNELPASAFDSMSRPKQVRIISSPTENAQARYLPQWFHELTSLPEASRTREKENAVVLCNESLLLPVLHSIPSEVKNVNITMGFPLAQTPVFSFIHALIELQTNGYRPREGRYTYEAVATLLRHPYIRLLSPQAQELERRLTRSNRFFPLPSELRSDPFLERLFVPQQGNLALCRYLTDMLCAVTAIYRREAEDEEQAEQVEQEEQKDIFNQLYRESLFKSYTLVNRLLSLIEAGDLNVQTDTFRRLLGRLLTATSIPFHGEPAIGMQIMGVLETRNLDFRNLIVLSLNEGQLPKAEGDSSFIPYNLRKAFGMTTIEHKNSVYAYYFYRLIQRAENITLLYNTSTEGLNRGEMSRFVQQFRLESPHPVSHHYLEAGQSPRHTPDIRIEKSPTVMERMMRTYDARLNPRMYLSPSALNAYMECPLRFYYRYVAGLKAPNEVSAEIDSALFGTIFHRSAEQVYQDLTAHGRDIRKEELERLLKDKRKLTQYVDNAFKENLFHIAPEHKAEYNGTQLINLKVITRYLRQLLTHDLHRTPFRMEGMEVPVQDSIEITAGEKKLLLNLGGTIDRMDSKEGTLRIIDYKTGGSPIFPARLEQVFIPAERRPAYCFQTFLYASILCRQRPVGEHISPALLYIHRAASPDYSPIINLDKKPVDDFRPHETEFREYLSQLLQEIFNPEIAFRQTGFPRKCEYCDYRKLCRR